MEMSFDPDSITIGEAIELEDLTGSTVDKLFAGGAMPMKALQALVFIVLKRENKEISLDEVSSMKITELDFSPKDKTSKRSNK